MPENALLEGTDYVRDNVLVARAIPYTVYVPRTVAKVLLSETAPTEAAQPFYSLISEL